MTFAATWSGGKDSCLASYSALRQGHPVSHLANFISQEHGRVRFHGIEAQLIRTQAEAIGIPLLQEKTAADSYEDGFKAGVRALISTGVDGLIFGDIHLQHCLEWAEKVCRDLHIQLLEPLWGRRTEEVLLDFIDSGFEAVVVSTQADLLGEEWIGRPVDESFLHDLKARGNIDLCGENGEYHTLVVDGPIFNQRIALLKTRPVYRDGYWFLDIQRYSLVPRAGVRGRTA